MTTIRIQDTLHQALLNQLQKQSVNTIASSSHTDSPESIEILVTRTEFETACAGLTRRAGDVLRRAIRSFRTASDSSSSSYDRVGQYERATKSKGDSELDDVIDELVMVGGGSLMPCIQTEAMSILQAEKMTPFLPVALGGEGRCLCTAVDPHFAVVEGLAIRAAVLMGCDVGSMQDVLMLDILPHSIGLLSWKKRADSISQGGSERNNASLSQAGAERQSEYVRVFDPIIRRGERIPATCSRRFPIETRTDTTFTTKLVSLDIYEDRGLVHNDIPSSSTASTSTSASKSEVCGEGRKEEVGSRYQLMGTYDVLIEYTSQKSTGTVAEVHEVEVEFTLNIHGGLTFKVRPVDSVNDIDMLSSSSSLIKQSVEGKEVAVTTTTTGTAATKATEDKASLEQRDSKKRKDDLDEKEDPLQMILLAVCAAVLLVLYGFAKSYLSIK